MISRSRLYAAFLLTSGSALAASDLAVPQQRFDRSSSRKSVRIAAAMEYVSLSYKASKETGGTVGSTVKVSGPAAGVSFLYGLNSKFAFTGAARQGFSAQTNFSSMFSELGIGMSYALTGSFVRNSEEVRYGNQPVMASRDYSTGGFRTTVMANQYFLNTSSTSVGLSGLGVSIIWEAPTTAEWSWFLGVRGDIASNGKITIFPVQGAAGISLWL